MAIVLQIPQTKKSKRTLALAPVTIKIWKLWKKEEAFFRTVVPIVTFSVTVKQKKPLPLFGNGCRIRSCLFDTVFFVELVHTAICLSELLTSSIEWV